MEPLPVALGMPAIRKCWPESGLNVDDLCGNGFRPLPFTEYIIKVHSRCNLACDYCYLYEMADQSWRDQPIAMSRTTFDEACRMIAEHVQRFNLSAINVVLFGGEPLLVGHSNLEYFAAQARAVLGPICDLQIGLQTNGALLDEEFLRICNKWNIGITVSLDGDERSHDRHRRDRRGNGSYQKIAAALDKLNSPNWRHLFSGLLCVIDLDNDPIQAYNGLLAFDPPKINFELPIGNWSSPPPGLHPGSGNTPYADWLLKIFDHWYGASNLSTHIRMFENIMDLLLGGSVASEVFGLGPIQLAVIETDGTVAQVDDLKSTYSGAPQLSQASTGNLLDWAMMNPSIVARHIGADALSDTCRTCPVKTICGGGHYVTRYHAESGFRNPSVYCADLMKLIRHIEFRMRSDIDASI
ncbi:FxsB family cyclophane-forming radical SAM/SPASM peptide maturase [Nocardia tengchongensis]|uniref:FxsB family cyclophane-forming radical SAM/SPASM peptide maturase n=1 Tax=Nocardia tengchongensis TaxID=2055889 RepID=UPI00367524E1